MRPELESVLAHVPAGASAGAYREAVFGSNAAGRTSVAGRTWAWKGLKSRYGVGEPEAEEFRAFRLAMDDSSPLGRGYTCALMFARLDRLFREVTLTRLSPMLVNSGSIVDPEVVRADIAAEMTAAGLVWADSTIASVTRHLLSAWKDFGLVTGSKERRTAAIRPTHQTVVFAAKLGRLEGLTDRQILTSRWFALFGLGESNVTTLMYNAARAGVLKIPDAG